MIIEADKRLSESLIWQLQRDYFLRAGPRAWQDDVVPHEISCSPYMAGCYADLILGYLRDCLAAKAAGELAWAADQPLYVVELGAGSGRLTYHLIHQLLPALNQPPFATLDLKFILADFVPATLAHWQAQPAWQDWVAAGLVDFAHFDAMAPAPLTLRHAGNRLDPQTMRNPVVLLANYFFDSLPQDSFVIAGGQLQHNLLTLLSDEPDIGRDSPALWQALHFAYEPFPLAEDPYSEDIYNQILYYYEANLAEARFSFPKVGLDCLRFWRRFGGGQQLWLTSDRGYSLAEALLDQPDPLPNLHGSFSMMVNYQAISQFVMATGGQPFFVDHYQDNLQVLAYALGTALNGLVETGRAFDSAVRGRSPDDFAALRRAFAQDYDNHSLADLLSFLRFSGYDAAICQEMLPALSRQIALAPASWQPDIVATLAEVRRRHLPLTEVDLLESQITPLLAQLSSLEEISP